MTTALAKNETAELMSMPVNPDTVIKEASKAAAALKKVLEKKPNKVMINKEQYLTFEDWQTLAYFYGYTVGATATDKIDGGYSATAKVWKGGVQVSGAEASCTADEPNWKNKPDFQLRSMAQTRACAKALRNVLAWVAVLAGYAATPAEEMDGGTKAWSGDAVTQKQINMILKLGSDLGNTSEEMREKIYKAYKVESTKELTKAQASGLIESLLKKIESKAAEGAEEQEEEVTEEVDPEDIPF